MWKIEDRGLFQHGVDGGKRELSKNPVLKGIIENFLGFLHPIELAEISHDRKNKFLGEFSLASFLVNMIIIIIIEF